MHASLLAYGSEIVGVCVYKLMQLLIDSYWNIDKFRQVLVIYINLIPNLNQSPPKLYVVS